MGVHQSGQTEVYAILLAVDVGKYRARDHAPLAEEVRLERDGVHAVGDAVHPDGHVLGVGRLEAKCVERHRRDGRRGEHVEKSGGCDVASQYLTGRAHAVVEPRQLLNERRLEGGLRALQLVELGGRTGLEVLLVEKDTSRQSAGGNEENDRDERDKVEYSAAALVARLDHAGRLVRDE